MPDARGGYGSGNRSRIIRACEAHWDEHYDNCSGFVVAVAKDLGIDLTPPANEIYEQVQKKPWETIGKGKEWADVAGVMAAHEGRFVLAVSKAESNGHVAVITDYVHKWTKSGPRDGRPYGYWGSLGAELVAGAREAKKESTNRLGEPISWTFGPYSALNRSWSDFGKVLFVYRDL